jgi:hypothetical protein
MTTPSGHRFGEVAPGRRVSSVQHCTDPGREVRRGREEQNEHCQRHQPKEPHDNMPDLIPVTPCPLITKMSRTPNEQNPFTGTSSFRVVRGAAPRWTDQLRTLIRVIAAKRTAERSVPRSRWRQPRCPRLASSIGE